LEKYASAFAEAEIDFETLPELEEGDLVELGLPLGPRRKLWGAIKRLGAAPTSLVDTPKDTDHPAREMSDPSASPDAERRHLTVMFVDLVGSTEMATRLDAEDMRTVITGYQNTVAGVVSRYKGFVAKFMGDGVMCYFGWPRAGEDDAERAVRAGLAIIDSIRTTKAPDGTALAALKRLNRSVIRGGQIIASPFAVRSAYRDRRGHKPHAEDLSVIDRRKRDGRLANLIMARLADEQVSMRNRADGD
jgi:hypothetical protein